MTLGCWDSCVLPTPQPWPCRIAWGWLWDVSVPQFPHMLGDAVRRGAASSLFIAGWGRWCWGRRVPRETPGCPPIPTALSMRVVVGTPPAWMRGRAPHIPLIPGCPGETEAQWGSSVPFLSQSLPVGWCGVVQAHPGERDSCVISALPAPRFAGSPWHGGSWGCSPIPPRLLSSVIENQPTLMNLTRADTRMLRDLRSL